MTDIVSAMVYRSASILAKSQAIIPFKRQKKERDTVTFWSVGGIYKKRGRIIIRKGAAGIMVVTTPQRVDERWSMDLATDITVTGRRFRALTMVDDHSTECPAIEVDTSLGGRRVASVLDCLAETRGLPALITIDNGPKFAGKTLNEWAYRKGVLNFIRPGKPIKNAFVESFNGRFRGECLNTNGKATNSKTANQRLTWLKVNRCHGS